MELKILTLSTLEALSARHYNPSLYVDCDWFNYYFRPINLAPHVFASNVHKSFRNLVNQFYEKNLDKCEADCILYVQSEGFQKELLLSLENEYTLYESSFTNVIHTTLRESTNERESRQFLIELNSHISSFIKNTKNTQYYDNSFREHGVHELFFSFREEILNPMYIKLANLISSLLENYRKTESKEIKSFKLLKTLKLYPHCLHWTLQDLKKGGFVNKDTSNRLFNDLFNFSVMSEKIFWVGTKADLCYFISSLIHSGLIANRGHWEITSNYFLIKYKGKYISYDSQNLSKTKYPIKKKQELIDLAISKLSDQIK